MFLRKRVLIKTNTTCYPSPFVFNVVTFYIPTCSTYIKEHFSLQPMSSCKYEGLVYIPPFLYNSPTTSYVFIKALKHLKSMFWRVFCLQRLCNLFAVIEKDAIPNREREGTFLDLADIGLGDIAEIVVPGATPSVILHTIVRSVSIIWFPAAPVIVVERRAIRPLVTCKISNSLDYLAKDNDTRFQKSCQVPWINYNDLLKPRRFVK